MIADRFAVRALARVGGMARLYRAEDLLAGGSVALKVMARLGPSDEARFHREARVLAELAHPALVRYVAHGEAGGVHYLAMEWLDGCDLAERLARGPLSAAAAVALVRSAAQALAVAHAHGVIHRDLKPSNVFLVDDKIERVKVIDFGIARFAHEASATVTGHVVGTPRYMAPEQVRARRDLDARCDVYGLGGLLFACVAGRPPFEGHDAMAVLAKVVLEDPPRLDELVPGTPPALAELVIAMMAKDREDRPRDADAVVAALEGVPTATADDGGPARPLVAITPGEQRLLSLVLVAAAGTQTTDETSIATEERARRAVDDLAAVAAAHGAELETLVDGTGLITVIGAGTATDQTLQAVRCAMALRVIAPHNAIAVATGRGQVARQRPVGEVIDRSALLLRAAGARDAPAIVVDETTAELVGERFEIVRDGELLTVVREREPERVRTLLGRSTACVGRDAELATLSALWDECVSEPSARAVLVTGGAGAGKSRLRYELCRRLAQRGDRFELWIGRGDPLGAGAPFALLAPAIRRAAGVLDGEPAAVRCDKLRARVSRHVAPADAARITEFIGELVGVPFPDETSVRLRTARHDPRIMNEQMRRAWEDWVAAETAQHPLLIVLEDLHWGDWPTAKLIDAILSDAVDRPVMVVALARPEVKELLPGLWAGRAVTELPLRNLSRKASERLAREALGERASTAVVERIVHQAAGNALFLEELIRAVADGKGDELPGSVLAMMQARMDRLPPPARRVLRAASVFGNLFWADGVAALIGRDETELPLSDWLQFLLDDELIGRRGDRRFPREDELVFRHALVREAAYSLLTEDDRRLGHRTAGEWLEAAGESDAVVLAEHYERGGEPVRAAAWWRRATEQALGANDLPATVARGARGLACLGDGAATDATLRGVFELLRAQAYGWLGRYHDQDASARAAMAMLPIGDPAWSTAVAEAASARAMLGEQAPLVEVGKELLAAAPPLLDRAFVLAVAYTASHLLFSGHHALAHQLLELIEPDVPRFTDDDPAVGAAVYRVQAVRAICAGDLAAGLVAKRASVEAYERAGDVPGAHQQRGNLGSVYVSLGAFAEAEVLLREATAAADRLGLPSVAALCRANLGTALGNLSKTDEATEVMRIAIKTLAEMCERRMEALTRADLAGILGRAGLLDAARAEATIAVELAADIPPSKAYALGFLARAALLAGDGAGALAAAAEAMTLLESLGGLDEGEAMVRLSFAESLDATGDRAGAAHAIARARARIEETAARIGDPTWRQSFLENVADCRRTLELDRLWNA